MVLQERYQYLKDSSSGEQEYDCFMKTTRCFFMFLERKGQAVNTKMIGINFKTARLDSFGVSHSSPGF